MVQIAPVSLMDAIHVLYVTHARQSEVKSKIKIECMFGPCMTSEFHVKA